jgi:hypothetical protein
MPYPAAPYTPGPVASITPMSRELDTQLLESVAVRRARLRESLVWGRQRRVRSTVDNVKRLAIGVVVAAIVSAGCVGWSFLQNMLAQQQARQQVGVTAPR